MSDTVNTSKDFDTYKIGGKTYMKDLYLGPKTWGMIASKTPGKFVDILEAKFTEKEFVQKINLSK